MGKKTFIIGASGAIGQELIAAITAAHGPHSVIAALHTSPLPDHLAATTLCEFGVDVRRADTILAALQKHAADIGTVWNLAAPLSVATAADPSAAHDITVGGMERILAAMKTVGLSKICFSDSIGSFGAEAPRELAPARWLVEHPAQDPGSAYGEQKRGCRELMRQYAVEHGFDTRFAIIPGVLHTKPSWGGGTTEYALDAIRAAATHVPYVCPLPLDAWLPMIHVRDLVRGLIALMDAPRAAITEPEGGYAIAGFSFTPAQLFATLAAAGEPAQYTVDLERNPPARRFAALWPDSISPAEAARDLHFEAQASMDATIREILAVSRARAHEAPVS
eukprot:m.19081 g.19081  ORF g.19081 m.19081 type:complete len:335 (-) comp3400_c0_seq1:126-1130(-)